MAGKKKSKRKAALAVQPSAEALERFKAAGIACGYEPAAMDRLAARCEGRPLSAGVRVKLNDLELSALIDDRLAWMFEFIDGHTLARMSGRDLLVGLGILFDKRQLLKGDPTGIMKFEDMRKLDDFLEDVSKELRRRGDGPEVIDVTPTPAAAPVANPGNGGMP